VYPHLRKIPRPLPRYNPLPSPLLFQVQLCLFIFLFICSYLSSCWQSFRPAGLLVVVFSFLPRLLPLTSLCPSRSLPWNSLTRASLTSCILEMRTGRFTALRFPLWQLRILLVQTRFGCQTPVFLSFTRLIQTFRKKMTFPLFRALAPVTHIGSLDEGLLVVAQGNSPHAPAKQGQFENSVRIVSLNPESAPSNAWREDKHRRISGLAAFKQGNYAGALEACLKCLSSHFFFLGDEYSILCAVEFPSQSTNIYNLKVSEQLDILEDPDRPAKLFTTSVKVGATGSPSFLTPLSDCQSISRKFDPSEETLSGKSSFPTNWSTTKLLSPLKAQLTPSVHQYLFSRSLLKSADY